VNMTGFDDYNPIKWKQDFSVGSSKIDNQHKKLMDCYNDTLAHCSGDRIMEREYFDNTIETFLEYLAEHFETEKQILSGTDYPQADEHILDHLKLLKKMSLIKEEVQNNSWKMNLHVLAITLKDWFLYHFDSYDSGAKEYFMKRDNIQSERKQQAVSA